MITLDLQIKGKIPSSAWKYLFILLLVCSGITMEGDLIELV